MDKLKYIKLERPDGSYSDSIPLSVSTDYVDINSSDKKSLTDYINTNNTNINDLQKKVDSNIKAVQGLSTGSPKGTYVDVSSLISANPDTGVYIITSNGHIYSYTKGSNTAIDLGIYQSTGIAENSIDFFELSQNLNDELSNTIRIQPTVNLNVHYRIADNVAYQYSYNGYSSCITEVGSGELYHIKMRESSVNTYAYIFVDNLEDMNVIGYGGRGTGSWAWFDSVIKVPNGANYMLSSFVHNSDAVMNSSTYLVEKFIPYSIKTLNKTITKDFVYTIPDYEQLKNSYYKIENGKGVWTAYQGTYNTITLEVSEGEAFYIKGCEHSLNTQLYLVLDSEDNILLSGGYGDGNYVYKEGNIIIPSGGVKLCITFTIKNGDSIWTDFILKKKKSLDDYLLDKKVSILGDSISTKIDKNAVEIKITEEDVGVELSAYLTYYDVQNNLSLGGHTFTSNEIGNEVTFTPNANDVGKVIGLANNYNSASIKTYWELLEEKCGCSINPVAWSGASLSSHEKNSNQYKTSYGWHDAQIRKIGIRTPGTMLRTEPDLIIIYRGVNDFSHTPYVSIDVSKLDNINYVYPSDDYNESTSKYDYIDALGIVISKIRSTYPNSRIAICTLGVFKRVTYSNYPTRNGLYTLPQFNNAIRKCADYFGLDLIELDKDGITFENCYSEGYITDSATIPTHPNSKGHAMIYNQIVKDLQFFS